MKNIKHFIWDFDGTLMNTYPHITSCFQAALRDLGIDVPKIDIMRQMLIDIPHTVKYFSELYDLSELDEHYKSYYSIAPTEPVQLFPFVKDVLETIKKNGGNNYIFTNRGDSTFPFLEEHGIKDLFTDIVTSSHPHFALKPAPDAILYIMEAHGANKENTVMIGDRLCDLGSAYNAGCKTILLQTKDIPQDLPCDWSIDSFEDMLNMLK